MTDEADTPGGARTVASGRTDWHGVTVALAGGLVAASFMFFLIAVFQPSGLDPPPESAALFLVATAAGVVSDRLLRSGSAAGYPTAMLTGGVVLVAVALIVAGTYGAAGPRTNPVGPIAYVALAVALIVAAGAAWRGETATVDSAGTSPTP